jgi:hypothetical protein
MRYAAEPTALLLSPVAAAIASSVSDAETVIGVE